MLLAYIDEIGSPGAFVSPTHPRFSDSPAFGYGGFIISEEFSRQFGAFFSPCKKTLFKNGIPEGQDPGRCERKGADLLFARTNVERPQNLRVLGSLISRLRNLKGSLSYYAEEKPISTPKETNCGPEEFRQREHTSMQETLNRIARHADKCNENVLVMMDQINEKAHKQRLPEMYAHIFGRSNEFHEMRRIIEPPIHIDSELSSNIQFADWVCALVKRAIEYQLVEKSHYRWIPVENSLSPARGAFTYDSKLHLCDRSVEDLHHSQIFHLYRPVIAAGTLATQNRLKLEQVRRASFRAKP